MDHQFNDNYAKHTTERPRRSLQATTQKDNHPGYVPAESNRREYLKLVAVFLVIALAATLMTGLQAFNWQEWLRWFMAGFFVIFGSFKLIGYEMFTMMFPGYNPIARRFKLYAYLYPFLELFLAMLYITNGLKGFRDVLTVTVTGIGAWGVFMAISREDRSIRCACLGNIIKLPLSTVSLLEDAIMALMALVMLLSYFFI